MDGETNGRVQRINLVLITLIITEHIALDYRKVFFENITVSISCVHLLWLTEILTLWATRTGWRLPRCYWPWRSRKISWKRCRNLSASVCRNLIYWMSMSKGLEWISMLLYSMLLWKVCRFGEGRGGRMEEIGGKRSRKTSKTRCSNLSTSACRHHIYWMSMSLGSGWDIDAACYTQCSHDRFVGL